MRTRAIVNGAAGGGRCGVLAKDAVDGLKQRDPDLEVRTTDAPGHATELAREATERGCERVVAFGGDGTAFEVLNGLGAELSLGLVPLGTGNSFLRDFGVRDARDALDRIERGVERRCDAVRVTHAKGSLRFLNLLGVGFVAEVGALTNARFKHFGMGGYALAVGARLARLSHAVHPLRLDGGPVDARPAVLLSFCNSQFTGGAMHMAPHADPSDGWLDVIRVGAMTRRTLLSTFPRIYQGSHVHHPLVEEARARSVTFESPREEDVMIDGEVLRLTLERLDVEPGAQRVLA